MSATVSLAIIKVLKKFNVPGLKVKWPNDIMSARYKISGILIENILKNNEIAASVIGVGLNVNQTDFPGYIYMTTWPSMFLAIFTDHIRMVRILPLSEELTEVTAEWVFRKETLKDKKYSMKNVVDFAVLVMKQDAEACELNQKGIHNPTRKNGTLMPEEYEIKRFHSWLRKKL